MSERYICKLRAGEIERVPQCGTLQLEAMLSLAWMSSYDDEFMVWELYALLTLLYCHCFISRY